MTPPDSSARTNSAAPETPVVSFDEIDSTSLEAARRAARGETGPLWITARRQSHGRGRSGRSFQSPDGGNLYASLLITLASPAAYLPQLSLLAGVAAWDAIRAVCDGELPPSLRLKWPNDLLIGEAKVCGILTESTIVGGSASAPRMSIVIGWGVNLATHPVGLDRPATSLAADGFHVTPEAMLLRLDEAFWHWFATWAGGTDFASVRAAWMERAGNIGEPIVFNGGEGPVEGRFLGLDDDGALLMADGAGQTRRVTFGDVSLPASTVSVTTTL